MNPKKYYNPFEQMTHKNSLFFSSHQNVEQMDGLLVYSRPVGEECTIHRKQVNIATHFYICVSH
jgi:hypothetical protein